MLYLVRLEDVKNRSIKGEIVSSENVDTESPLKIHLGQSLIKGNKFDLVLRKSVELGVHTITPLLTDRTILKGDNDKKIPRWKKIIEESSKQCGISSIPQISRTVTKLDAYCQQSKNSDLKLMFWEMEKDKGLKDIKPIDIPRVLLPALEAVAIQIQTRINGRRVRRTKQVVEIVGVDPHSQEVITNEVFKWDPARDDFDFSGKSYVLEKIMVKINYSQEKMRQELRTRKRILDWMVLNDIRKSDQVAQIITEYYVRPNDVLARVDGLR